MQHIEQGTTLKRMIRITAVQDILELHHIVSVSEFDTPHNSYRNVHLPPNASGGCPSLSLIVSNGIVIVNSTLVGDTASYSCNPGYAVDGAAVLTCQMNSSWNNEVPTCRRKCKH